MGIDYRDGVSILQLIVFPPCTVLAFLLCFRHGFGKASGWYFMITFSLLRITGAILQFISHSSNASTAKQAITGVLVCNSIGLAPLNLVLVGMLSRVNDFITRQLPPLLFKAIALLSLVGLILGIDGGIHSGYSSANGVSISSMSKAAIIIFLVTFITQLVLLCVLATRSSEIIGGEKRLLLAVAVASPFLLVRFVYSLRYDFSGDLSWSSAFGSVTKYLCMSVLMEIAIVLIALGTGLTLRRHLRKKEDLPVRTDSGSGVKLSGSAIPDEGIDLAPQLGRPTRPKRKFHGPVSWLFLTIKDAVASRRQ